MLRKIPDERLSVLVVWEPILRLDTELAARRATDLFPDSRARQFWAPTTAVGEQFQPAIGLASEPAWDVYLFYDRGAKWNTGPPRPRDFMHQLGGRLPEGKRLSGDAMAQGISPGRLG